MKASTKQRVRAWLWPVAMSLYGISEMVRAAGDVTQMSWHELLVRTEKAAPFVVVGLIMRKLFLTDPKDESGGKA